MKKRFEPTGDESASESRTESGSPQPKYPKAGYINIVPLLAPRSEESADELAGAPLMARNGAQSDGRTASVGLSPHFVYSGGPLLTEVAVFTVFWGKKWSAGSGAETAIKVNNFYKAILVSSLMDQLAEYSVPGKAIQRGSLIGSKTITADAPKPLVGVTDAEIRFQLQQWIRAHTVPEPTSNTLYFIYLEPGIPSRKEDHSASCSHYCGYHDAVDEKIYYAVMPYPKNCSRCLGGMSEFDALTAISSHELCEAITDPIPTSGWYDTAQGGEIGDVCARFKTVAGYKVQLEWSNAHDKCL